MANKRSGVSSRNRSFNVEFALTPVIENAVRGVAALLNLCNDEVGADRMDRSRRHRHDVPCRHRLPRDKLRDRAVFDGLTKILRRCLLSEAERNLCSGCSAYNVPSLSLAVRQSNRLRVSIVGVDLDGQRLAGEQHFEQQRGVRGRFARAFIADLANGDAIIGSSDRELPADNAPRSRHRHCSRKFDRHGVGPW